MCWGPKFRKNINEWEIEYVTNLLAHLEAGKTLGIGEDCRLEWYFKEKVFSTICPRKPS